MPRRKRDKGRPLTHKYPPRIDASPEVIAEAFFAVPADTQVRADADYHCVDCKCEVNYPDTLYDDGRCEACHLVAAA